MIKKTPDYTADQQENNIVTYKRDAGNTALNLVALIIFFIATSILTYFFFFEIPHQ